MLCWQSLRHIEIGMLLRWNSFRRRIMLISRYVKSPVRDNWLILEHAA